MLHLQHATPAGQIDMRFYGAERPGFGENTAATYNEILTSATGAAAMVYLHQVHGDQIHEVKNAALGVRPVGEGDALITGDAGTALVIRTADCIPILIFCPKTGLIAAVHAGWRGLASRIVSKTLSRLAESYQAEKAGLQFVVGPCISGDAYEVGAEVASQFSPGASRASSNAGKYLLNLAHVLREELESNGIVSAQVDWRDADTFTSAEWYSARQGDTLRNFTCVVRLS